MPKGYSKIGDDVAVLPSRKGRLVVKVDMLVERTDMPPGMTYRQAARKAVAMCVSDFTAKGVRPDSFLVSLGVEREISQEKVEELALGFKDAQREWGVNLVGGDTNESNGLVIDCAMVGFGKRIVTRSGASPGDTLVVTGPFGYSAAGLKILLTRARSDAKFAKIARENVLNPSPNLAAGLVLAPFLTSSMDSSDGLARSLHTLARESEVGFEVTNLPAGPGVKKFATANGLSTEKLVLEGGEEYVIVGTIKESKLAAAATGIRKAGGRLIEIGVATSRRGKVELRLGGSHRPIKDEGWTHLRRS